MKQASGLVQRTLNLTFFFKAQQAYNKISITLIQETKAKALCLSSPKLSDDHTVFT